MCISVSLHVTYAQKERFYSTENGLSNSLINKIYQDYKGYIWIATEYGLNKFDGIKYTNYNHIPNDTNSLANNYVQNIYEDKQRTLYIATITGLMTYNRAKDCFETVQMYNDGVITLPHVVSIDESLDGTIWIGTSGEGVFKINEGETCAVFAKDVSKVITSNYLNALFIDSKDKLWIGTQNDGLTSYDLQTQQVQIFREPAQLSSDKISVITEDTEGRICVGTHASGLNVYDAETHRFHAIPYKGASSLTVSSLLVNSNKQLLIGTDGQGLKVYKRANNLIEDYEMNPTPFDFSKSKVHSIFEDQDKNSWLGIFQKGILFVPFKQNKFDYYGYNSYKHNSIGSSCVMSISKDKQGLIWIGTDNDGIYTINSQGQRINHFYDAGTPRSAPNAALSVYNDSDDNLWVGSYTKGLGRFNKQTGQCDYITQFRDKKVYFVTEDRNQNILIGTHGSGMYIYNRISKRIEEYQNKDRKAKGEFSIETIGNNWINTIIYDTQERIWIGHYRGLDCMDAKTRRLIKIKSDIDMANIVVFDLFEDTNQTIWMGTSSGLLLYDKQQQYIRKYTESEWLSQNVICGISQDDSSNIWVSTYYGICKLNVENKKVTRYNAGDGLQGNEFTRGAVYRSQEGKIYFGGTNGVTAFYPNDITDNKRKLKIGLTNFYLSNKAIRLGDMSGENPIINTSLADADTFTLSYNDNTFSLEFSSFEYSNPERITYQYMIKELDTEWQSPISGTNNVTYNNLSPDKYTFMIRACDNDNYSEIKTLFIVITPPWFQTWWAYLLYLILAILILWIVINYVVSRVRYRHKLMQAKYAEQVNEAKLQFFINISHEIRTPMTLIINPLEKLIADNKDQDKNKTYHIIYRNAQRILRLINQLMDVRKLDKGLMVLNCQHTDMVGFIKDLMLTFDYQAQKRHIQFVFEEHPQQLQVWIDLNNFDKILMNVLSNAFKYTADEGAIVIKLSTAKDERVTSPLHSYFEISISDTGVGIDEHQIEAIFGRFYQISNPITNSSVGTGIGLHLTQQLVKLHGGVIYAENRTDIKGSRFTIRIPLVNSPINPTAENIQSTPLRKMIVEEHQFEVQEKVKKRTRSKTNYKILIVEDEDEIRSYLHDELSVYYKVSECKNGKEALAFVLKEQPDLVISDVMMPEMDGISLSKKMKQNININHISIILLTAKTRVEDRLEGIGTGADAYLEKPFNTEILRQTIDNLLVNKNRLRNKYEGNQDQKNRLDKLSIKPSDELLMERVMKVVNEHISNPQLNVEMLADKIGMSRVHMYRKMKELTNMSTLEFIRNIRLKQAASLLENKKLSISEVAYATGFSNLSHFSSSFKDFYGVSPTEFMAKHK
jgi:signal transduction histidine kinase/ligand-binding sensor domain-containing protein/DNA-binding response OmpR family regulator